jgi:CheY-like chemotaxis protein
VLVTRVLKRTWSVRSANASSFTRFGSSPHFESFEEARVGAIPRFGSTGSMCSILLPRPDDRLPDVLMLRLLVRHQPRDEQRGNRQACCHEHHKTRWRVVLPPDTPNALVDLGLPVMDGFELADRLRAEPALKDLTLIALTGYAQEIDRDRTAASGFDVHLAKPIDVHQVAELIRVASMKQA